ncbi:pyrimidine-nucleoside phosphorylase [Carnobacterium divergens]|uniref:pyrimidine-nucleoside phosphorylase n=2 Tax=Carnobacterium divergens TaxID=2748 RepID=UPI00288DCE98|nr:pyrimidine-nucleoside phosphorylase [Carnobacterium divergens]
MKGTIHFMLKKIVYSAWLISIIYFICYLTIPFLENAVKSGGLMIYIHVIMDLILIGGFFFIFVSIIRFFFANPDK